MTWLRTPRTRWWLLAGAWAALLVLGIGGFLQQSGDLGTTRSFLDSLYFTLQLAALDYQGDSESVNWRLQIARFVAPAIAASTLVQSASIVFREQFARFRARRARNHTVLCGLGPIGARLAAALVADGRTLVAVEADPVAPGIATANDLGIPVVIGDPTDVSVLEAARVGRASRVIAIASTDAQNAAIAAAVRAVHRPAGLAPLRCAVHLIDAELAGLLRTTELSGSTGLRVEFFNTHERAAAALLGEFPLASTADTPQPHLLITGLGQFGSNVVVAAARAHAAGHDGPLGVTLVDRRATARFHALRMQHPALADAVDATCLDLDFGAPDAAAVDGFDEILRTHAPSLVVVAFEDETLAWSTGLFIHPRLGDSSATVVIRTESDGGLASLLDGATSGVDRTTAPRLATFPFLDRACSTDLVDGGVREQLARSLHDDHVARTSGATVGAGTAGAYHASWESLDDTLRESSRSGADGLIAQLRSIGCEPAPLRRWGQSDRVLRDDEIDRVAAGEHARWMAEREAAGWTWGERRDDAARHNPLLRHWEELDEADRARNHEAIAALPTILARAGFEIQRRHIDAT